jgi:hypothetical protein
VTQKCEESTPKKLKQVVVKKADKVAVNRKNNSSSAISKYLDSFVG